MSFLTTKARVALFACASFAVVTSCGDNTLGPRPSQYIKEGYLWQMPVSFPWHCRFSPDGRWLGVSDPSSVGVWDMRSRAWIALLDGGGGGSRMDFSFDSLRIVLLARGGLHSFVWDGERWTSDVLIPLPTEADPGIGLRTSPARLCMTADGKGAVFVSRDIAWRVDLNAGRIVPILSNIKDVMAAFVLPDETIAISRRDSLSSIFVARNGGQTSMSGVILELSRDGRLALVAHDAARFHLGALASNESVSLGLEIRTLGGPTISKFELTGRNASGRGITHRLLIQGEFSWDNRLLATVEGMGQIVIREVSTGEPVQYINEYRAAAYAMGASFGKEDEVLVTGGRAVGVGGAVDSGLLAWRRGEGRSR